ncbi:allergen Tha p 1-like [Aricia agestis]|uniref:allergen Tha p 1-like n=1 Tax=Aricia agestis TaxID=91739 RepID=UPI001C205C57|nr:allergen Tha p 1-like [Aricia agestis]
MKFLIACALVLAVAAAEDYLVTKDDNFDFTKLSHDELTAVAKCFMNQGPCNELLLSYKQHYPAVIIDACNRCNPKQKKISKVYFGRLQKELPDVYHQLRKHMDPENKYFSNFLASIDLSE